MSTFDPHEDLYALLEVPPDASDEQIREQYRKLVQQYLWDREKFARLNRAFEVLSNPELRAEYDKQAAIARPRPDLSTLAAPPPETAPTIVGAPAPDLLATQQIADVQRTQMGVRVTCPVCKTETSAIDGYCEECGFALSGAEGVQELTPPDVAELPVLVDMQGNTYTLRPGVNTVGRLNADVLLSDPSVSRSHARIIVQNGTVTIEDVGSTNGTFVNGQKLTPQVPVPLADGAEITFGGTRMTLRIPVAPPVQPAVSEAVLATSAPVTQTLTVTAEEQETPSEEAPEEAEVVAYWCSEDGTMRVPLSPGMYTIGRRPSNHIVIPDPYVSGNHAILLVEPDLIHIEDVGSTNGTFVDETKLIAHVAAPLPFGVKVQIGQGTFYLEAAERALPSDEETAEATQTASEEDIDDASQQ
ncbi:MAG: FHA domain-containing protein [Chthonomonadetes bacterium]|nr:FHA domain-containing protein [Chthonomonadetes bacterium]